MTNKELNEICARALELRLFLSPVYKKPQVYYDKNDDYVCGYKDWKPTTDPAQAIELAEKFHFSIWCCGGPDKYKYGAGYWRKGNLLCCSYELSEEECLSPICATLPLAICEAIAAEMKGK